MASFQDEFSLADKIRQDKLALDALTKIDPNEPEYQQAKQSLGLQDEDIKAYKYANEIKDSKTANKVKNLVFDKIADAQPPLNVGGSTFGERFYAKNILDTATPDEQAGYFQKKGYNTKFGSNNELLIKKQNQTRWNKVDPEGIDIFDFTDVALDTASAIGQGIATVAAPVFGGVAGSAAISGATELGKQLIGNTLGDRPLNIGEIAKQSAIGGVAGAIGKGVSSLLTKGVRFLSGTVEKPVVSAATETLESTISAPLRSQAETSGKILGIEELLPSQKYAGRELQNLQGYLLESSTLPGRGLRKTAENISQKIEENAKSLVDKAAGISAFDVGENVKKGVLDKVKQMIQPAEEIYQSVENQFKEIPVKKEELNSVISELQKKYKFPDADKVINNAKEYFDRIATVDDLKQARTALSRRLGGELDPTERAIIGEINENLTNVRSTTLKSVAPELADQISKADQIYKQAINTVQDSLGIERLRGGLVGTVSKNLEKDTAENITKKLVNFKDFKQVKNFADNFPEQFETAKNYRIQELIDRSTGSTGRFKGQLDPKKLVKNIDQLGPEMKQLIFGDQGMKKAEALSKFIDTLPESFNPSGTGRFVEQLFKDVMPNNWGRTASDLNKRLLISVQSQLAEQSGLFNPLVRGGAKAGTFGGLKFLENMQNNQGGNK